MLVVFRWKIHDIVDGAAVSLSRYKEIADVTEIEESVFEPGACDNIYPWGLNWSVGLQVQEKLWYRTVAWEK